MKSADPGGSYSLSRRITTAAAWMVAFRWLDRLIGILSLAVLARLLSPADFGLVAYGTLVIGILELFTGLSTDSELIRHARADRSYYNAAWTMNVLRGVVMAALLLALIRPAVTFFHEPRLVAIMLSLSAIPLIQGFENVGIVDFRKQLEFDREFRFLLTSRIVGTVATIIFALLLHSYWALIVGTLFRAVFRIAWSYRVHPFRPRFALAGIRDIFRFTRWMMIQNLASGLNDRLPGIVIGREWGSSALAYFNVAKEISDLSATEIRAPIRRALYPGLARLAERPTHLGDVLISATGMLALLTLPIPLGIALVSDDLVPLFLGEQWQPAIALVQPLCIAASVAAVGTNSQLAYMALNRSHLAAVAVSLRALLVLVVLLLVGRSYGVVGVAYAIAAITCVMTALDYALAPRLLDIRVRRLLAVVWRPVAAAVAMAGAVWLLQLASVPAHDTAGHLWALIRATLLGAVVYTVCVVILWTLGGCRDGAEKWLIALVKEQHARLSRTTA